MKDGSVYELLVVAAEMVLYLYYYILSVTHISPLCLILLVQFVIPVVSGFHIFQQERV